jgi:HK97 family phage portal protein
LHDVWNATTTAFEGREMLVRDLDLYGNSFHQIERNGRGQVTALWRIAPHDVTVEELDNGRLRYKTYFQGKTTTFLQEEILHVRGPSRDGILGLSPIAIARGSLNLALTNQQTAQALAANALRPSGMVSFAERLTGEQRELFRDRVAEKYGGAANSGKLLVVDGGAKFEKLSFSPEDAQFLESRKLANEDVARIFSVPATAAGILDKATYSNIEQEGRALVQNCLGPLAARIEAAMQRCLLTEVGRRTLYVEHDLSGLLRGDVHSRFEAYRIGREIGALSPNDVRRFENQPPIPGGDIYNTPANWNELGSTNTSGAN